MRARGALVVLLASVLFARAEPRIQWVPAADRIVVEVSGLDEAARDSVRDWPAEKWRSLFAVRVRKEGVPAMLGAWRAEGSVIRFTPQFPLTPRVAYRADFDAARLPGAAAGAPHVTSDFIMPDLPRGPATVVKNLFPSADELPENLLKFYLHFSAPMSRGQIYEHIHLRDEAGQDVELPFLEIDEELWDPEMKRLTLFIDPGRIKREVRPLEEIGPALQEGHRFTLVIDAAWLDAAGQPLAQKFEHHFRVGPPDRTPITPVEWLITAPAARTRAPLRVTFPEPLDHALALRLLQVTRAGGTPVNGVAALANAERDWSFIPTEPWQTGAHQLIIPTILEDLAGNNVGKAFEVEMRERGERLETAESVQRTFEIK